MTRSRRCSGTPCGALTYAWDLDGDGAFDDSTASQPTYTYNISFSGSATDQQDGALPASALRWDLVLNHCPSNCHQHTIQTYQGVASGSFTAPDGEYPSYLELRLTTTDSGGRGQTVARRLDSRAVALTFQTSPGGLSISAVSPQRKGSKTYTFRSWSDGGAQTHTIVAPATAATYAARFSR